MRHSFVDKYADRDSILHRLDPRVRICLFLLLILAAITTPPGSFLHLIELAALLGVLTALSRIPIGFIAKRALMLSPFLLMVVLMAPFLEVKSITTQLDLKVAQLSVSTRALMVTAVAVKSLISMVSVILLINSGRFTEFLKALQKLRMPSILVSILIFMYRYIFIIVDQFQRMLSARKSRTFSNNYKQRYRGLPQLIGMGFIRSSERGERVYAAMLARGFDGTIRSMCRLRIRPIDIVAGLAMVLVIFLIKSG